MLPPPVPRSPPPADAHLRFTCSALWLANRDVAEVQDLSEAERQALARVYGTVQQVRCAGRRAAHLRPCVLLPQPAAPATQASSGPPARCSPLLPSPHAPCLQYSFALGAAGRRQLARPGKASNRLGVTEDKGSWRATFRGQVLYSGHSLDAASRAFDVAAIMKFGRCAWLAGPGLAAARAGGSTPCGRALTQHAVCRPPCTRSLAKTNSNYAAEFPPAALEVIDRAFLLQVGAAAALQRLLELLPQPLKQSVRLRRAGPSHRLPLAAPLHV